MFSENSTINSELYIFFPESNSIVTNVCLSVCSEPKPLTQHKIILSPYQYLHHYLHNHLQHYPHHLLHHHIHQHPQCLLQTFISRLLSFSACFLFINLLYTYRNIIIVDLFLAGQAVASCTLLSTDHQNYLIPLGSRRSPWFCLTRFRHILFATNCFSQIF